MCVSPQLGKLEETIRPLQSDIRDLQSQRDALATDKKSLTVEMERWKTRTNQLIEQSHKTDPEERKRILWVSGNSSCHISYCALMLNKSFLENR